MPKAVNLTGDRQTALFSAHMLPCTLTVLDGDTQTVTQTTLLVELWTNPHTGLLEPFYAVKLDGRGRLYETNVGLTAVQVVPPSKPAPDWGGLDQEPLNLDIGPHIPIAWVLTLLATAVSLGLLVWWLRTAR